MQRHSSTSSSSSSSFRGLFPTVTGPGIISDAAGRLEELERKQKTQKLNSRELSELAEYKDVLKSASKSLGNIAPLNRPAYIFIETALSLEYVSRVYRGMAEDDAVRQKFNNLTRPGQSASCISFAVNRENGQEVCMIAISGGELTITLRAIIEGQVKKLNAVKDKKYGNYSLLPFKKWEEDRMLTYCRNLRIHIDKKRCAEAQLIPELKEQFRAHGEKFVLLGNANVPSYIFKEGVEDKIKFNKNGKYNITKIDLGNGFFTCTMSACKNCAKMKKAAIGVMADARTVGQQKITRSAPSPSEPRAFVRYCRPIDRRIEDLRARAAFRSRRSQVTAPVSLSSSPSPFVNSASTPQSSHDTAPSAVHSPIPPAFTPSAMPVTGSAVAPGLQGLSDAAPHPASSLASVLSSSTPPSEVKSEERKEERKEEGKAPEKSKIFQDCFELVSKGNLEQALRMASDLLKEAQSSVGVGGRDKATQALWEVFVEEFYPYQKRDQKLFSFIVRREFRTTLNPHPTVSASASSSFGLLSTTRPRAPSSGDADTADKRHEKRFKR